MKKGELKQAFDTLQYVMNKPGLEPNVVKAIIANEKSLKSALEKLDEELVFVPSDESTKFYNALDESLKDLREKNMEEFRQYDEKNRGKEVYPVPPKLINKWNKLMEKARQNFPEGAKYVDDYQAKKLEILDQVSDIEFETVAINGFTPNEVKALSFMMYGLDV